MNKQTFADLYATRIDVDPVVHELARRLNKATEALWVAYAVAKDEKLLDEVELEMEAEFIHGLEEIPPGFK